MTRFLPLLTALIIHAGCSGAGDTAHRQAPPEKMELGWIQRSNFVRPEYPAFLANYDTVRLDDNFVEMIKSLHTGTEFVVVLGTWCSDSKREVPRFLKIADRAGIPPSAIRYYGVDRTKSSHDGVTEQYHIERVPTFIVLTNGMEVGRIVESPKNSLEEDLLVILADAQNK